MTRLLPLFILIVAACGPDSQPPSDSGDGPPRPEITAEDRAAAAAVAAEMLPRIERELAQRQRGKRLQPATIAARTPAETPLLHGRRRLPLPPPVRG